MLRSWRAHTGAELDLLVVRGAGRRGKNRPSLTELDLVSILLGALDGVEPKRSPSDYADAESSSPTAVAN